MIEITLQEKETSVDVNPNKRNKLEIKQFCLEVKQEWAALENVLQNVRQAILHQLIRILDRLDHVIVDLRVSESNGFDLMRGDAQQLHIVVRQLLQLLVDDGLVEEEVDALLCQ